MDVLKGQYIATIKGSPWVEPFENEKLNSNVCSFSCGVVAGVMMAAGVFRLSWKRRNVRPRGTIIAKWLPD